MKASEENLDLMHRYLTGEADAETVRKLGVRLKADAELRRDFLAYARMDAALAAMPRGVVSPRKPARWRVWAPIAAAAAMIAAAFLLWMMPAGGNGVPVATLVTSTNAEWADPNVDLMLRAGELPGGLLKLVSGEVELATSGGARVLLQAPVAVRFISEKQLVCEEGRVVCDCPTPLSRLTVETPQTTVVDLGTVFSVEAQRDASTLVSVLSGEVELRGGEPRRVRQGEVAVVRSTVVRITPMSDAESAHFDPMLNHGNPTTATMPNRLGHSWRASSELVSIDEQSGKVRIRAGDLRPFPMARQTLASGRIAGRTVAASAWAISPDDDPLVGRQHAVLKLAFLDASGREFACTFRHFLHAQRGIERREQALLAVIAPAGTEAVELQLILNTDQRKQGSIVFDDAHLGIEASSSP